MTKQDLIVSQLPGYSWENVFEKFGDLDYFQVLEKLDKIDNKKDNHDLAMMIYYEVGAWVKIW